MPRPPRVLYTNHALAAILSDEPVCPKCNGSGRNTVAPRNACGPCLGLGVPRTSPFGVEILWAQAKAAEAEPRPVF